MRYLSPYLSENEKLSVLKRILRGSNKGSVHDTIELPPVLSATDETVLSPTDEKRDNLKWPISPLREIDSKLLAKGYQNLEFHSRTSPFPMDPQIDDREYVIGPQDPNISPEEYESDDDDLYRFGLRTFSSKILSGDVVPEGYTEAPDKKYKTWDVLYIPRRTEKMKLSGETPAPVKVDNLNRDGMLNIFKQAESFYVLDIREAETKGLTLEASEERREKRDSVSTLSQPQDSFLENEEMEEAYRNYAQGFGIMVPDSESIKFVGKKKDRELQDDTKKTLIQKLKSKAAHAIEGGKLTDDELRQLYEHGFLVVPEPPKEMAVTTDGITSLMSRAFDGDISSDRDLRTLYDEGFLEIQQKKTPTTCETDELLSRAEQGEKMTDSQLRHLYEEGFLGLPGKAEKLIEYGIKSLVAQALESQDEVTNEQLRSLYNEGVLEIQSVSRKPEMMESISTVRIGPDDQSIDQMTDAELLAACEDGLKGLPTSIVQKFLKHEVKTIGPEVLKQEGITKKTLYNVFKNGFQMTPDELAKKLAQEGGYGKELGSAQKPKSTEAAANFTIVHNSDDGTYTLLSKDGVSEVRTKLNLPPIDNTQFRSSLTDAMLASKYLTGHDFVFIGDAADAAMQKLNVGRSRYLRGPKSGMSGGSGRGAIYDRFHKSIMKEIPFQRKKRTLPKTTSDHAKRLTCNACFVKSLHVHPEETKRTMPTGQLDADRILSAVLEEKMMQPILTVTEEAAKQQRSEESASQMKIPMSGESLYKASSQAMSKYDEYAAIREHDIAQQPRMKSLLSGEASMRTSRTIRTSRVSSQIIGMPKFHDSAATREHDITQKYKHHAIAVLEQDSSQKVGLLESQAKKEAKSTGKLEMNRLLKDSFKRVKSTDESFLRPATPKRTLSRETALKQPAPAEIPPIPVDADAGRMGLQMKDERGKKKTTTQIGQVDSGIIIRDERPKKAFAAEPVSVEAGRRPKKSKDAVDSTVGARTLDKTRSTSIGFLASSEEKGEAFQGPVVRDKKLKTSKRYAGLVKKENLQAEVRQTTKKFDNKGSVEIIGQKAVHQDGINSDKTIKFPCMKPSKFERKGRFLKPKITKKKLETRRDSATAAAIHRRISTRKPDDDYAEAEIADTQYADEMEMKEMLQDAGVISKHKGRGASSMQMDSAELLDVGDNDMVDTDETTQTTTTGDFQTIGDFVAEQEKIYESLEQDTTDPNVQKFGISSQKKGAGRGELEKRKSQASPFGMYDELLGISSARKRQLLGLLKKSFTDEEQISYYTHSQDDHHTVMKRLRESILHSKNRKSDFSQLLHLDADNAPWFEFPMNMSELVDMHPRVYMKKYCIMNPRRQQVYTRIFRKYSDYDQCIKRKKITDAVNDLIVGNFTQEQMDDILELLMCTHTQKFDTELFFSISCLAERLADRYFDTDVPPPRNYLAELDENIILMHLDRLDVNNPLYHLLKAIVGNLWSD